MGWMSFIVFSSDWMENTGDTRGGLNGRGNFCGTLATPPATLLKAVSDQPFMGHAPLSDRASPWLYPSSSDRSTATKTLCNPPPG